MVSGEEHRDREEVSLREGRVEVPQDAPQQPPEGPQLEEHVLVENPPPQARPGHAQDPAPRAEHRGDGEPGHHHGAESELGRRGEPPEPHDGHHDERRAGRAGRHRQAPPLAPELFRLLIEGPRPVRVPDPEPQVPQHPLNPDRGDPARIVANQRFLVGEVDPGFVHAVEAPERPGDAPGAERARQAAEPELERRPAGRTVGGRNHCHGARINPGVPSKVNPANLLRGRNAVRIGELAARVGVTPDTIRYYEREGLLPQAPRTGGGYRMYDRRALTDLAFILKAQAAGLALREIREVLQICAEGRAPCDHVRATVRGRLDEVERRMRDLHALRTSLRATLRRLDRAPKAIAGCQCPAIEATPTPRSPRGSPVRQAGGRRRGAA